jgi:sugar/nucleoside kinase (ribokinase family)
VRDACDAVVAGHICLDIIPALTGRTFTFDPGKLVEVGPAISSTGGPVSNTGMALHRLGIRTRLMGKVGADPFGRMILDIVEAFSPELARGMIQVPGEVTSYSIILSPRGADRMFLHCPGCNDTFGADDIDYAILRSARLFHFGYPPLMKRMTLENGRELADLLRRAKEAGATTSLDMCMPDPGGYGGTVIWPAVIEASLPYVDIYMPSLEETLVMSYPDKYGTLVELQEECIVARMTELLSGVSRDLLSLGPAIVGLKLGARGLYLRSGDIGRLARLGRARPRNETDWANRELWSPCFKTSVVGTTGAGDATIAGFSAALLRGNSPESCLTMACAVGACNVEAADALSGVRSWEETLLRVQGGWLRNELPLAQAGWEKDAFTGVWRSSKDAFASAAQP